VSIDKFTGDEKLKIYGYFKYYDLDNHVIIQLIGPHIFIICTDYFKCDLISYFKSFKSDIGLDIEVVLKEDLKQYNIKIYEIIKRSDHGNKLD
jgi:hypothetical protein